jgi:5-methylcytosine-specific restriction protein A
LSRIDLLRNVLERGIGTGIVVEADNSGIRTGLRSYFAGLTQNQGPVCTITPSGLKRHIVTLRFGRFPNPCIAQMQAATEERKLVARALIHQLAKTNELTIVPEQPLENWIVTGADFLIEVVVRNVQSPLSPEALERTAGRVMVPLMASMAELIGYDEDEETAGETEGDLLLGTIRRRERSPRNRLLCLSVHGHKCSACGFVPSEVYGDAGEIIEVHHLEPLGLIEQPRTYDPRADLVPLCPNCHRAIHTRRPVPYTLDELKEMLGRGSD